MNVYGQSMRRVWIRGFQLIPRCSLRWSQGSRQTSCGFCSTGRPIFQIGPFWWGMMVWYALICTICESRKLTMCMAYPDYPLIILDRSWRWLRRNLCPSLDWIHPPRQPLRDTWKSGVYHQRLEVRLMRLMVLAVSWGSQFLGWFA